ncbi:MAG: diguanylate cyclase [Rhodocyclaceae bacterium]
MKPVEPALKRSNNSPPKPTRGLASWIRLGAVITVLVTVIPLLVVVDQFAKRYAERQAAESLTQVASQMRDELDRGMSERYEEILRLAGAETFIEMERPERLRRVLERLQESFPFYAWLGVTDAQGTVQLATNGLLEGVDVSARPWFGAALKGPYVGNVHPALLLEKHLPAQHEPWRFIDIAAPLKRADGQIRGVIGAHLSWGWARQLQHELIEPRLHALDAELWIVDRDGNVILGPQGAGGDKLSLDSIGRATSQGRGYMFESWPDGKRYATAYIQTTGHQRYPGLGWIVLVRQPEAVVYAEFRELQAMLVVTGAIVCSIFFLFSTLLARSLARPLDELAKVVERYASGERDINVPAQPKYRESMVLSGAIGQMVAAERRHLTELAQMNASLEQRVEDRTEALHEANEHLAQALAERAHAEDAALRSEEQVRDILRNANVACITIDARGKITSWNRQAQYTFGWTASEAIGQDAAELVVAEERRMAFAAGLSAMARGTRASFGSERIELSLIRRDGTPFIGEMTTSVVHHGDEVVMTGFVHDISERKEAERALHESRERLKTITDNLPVLIAYVGTDLRYQFNNEAYYTVFGIRPEELLGRRMGDTATDDSLLRAMPYIERVLAGEQVEFEYIVALHEREHYMLTTYVPHFDETSREVLGFYAMALDITVRKTLELTLEQQALQDPLTGLPNRRALRERLPQALARADRWNKSCALLFLDLDGFKNINDSLGHEAGDELLRQFADRLTRLVRQTDTVARLAGDEFTILLESLAGGSHDAVEVGHHIVDAMRRPFALDGHDVIMTTSVGIALYTPHTHGNVDELLATADSAMYDAKRSGKNQLCLANADAHA